MCFLSKPWVQTVRDSVVSVSIRTWSTITRPTSGPSHRHVFSPETPRWLKHTLHSELPLINAHFKPQRWLQHRDSVFKRRFKAALAGASFRFVLPFAGGQTGRLPVYRLPPASALLPSSLPLLSGAPWVYRRWILRLFGVLFRFRSRWLLDGAEARAPSLALSLGRTAQAQSRGTGGGSQGACATPSCLGRLPEIWISCRDTCQEGVRLPVHLSVCGSVWTINNPRINNNVY